MADLVAYRGLIEDVPEWPFTSTYTRFILYMLIPVAFWVLGVVAEEIVGHATFIANTRSPLSQRASLIDWGGSFGAAPARIWPLHAPDLVLVGQPTNHTSAYGRYRLLPCLCWKR